MALHNMNDGCVERALNEIRYADQIRKEAVYTGYRNLDAQLGGMLPGEIYLIGARPAMGKSCFAYNLLRRMCVENGTPAMLFSLEASAEYVIRTMIKSICDVCSERNLSLKELEAYERAANSIKTSPFLIEDAFNLTVDGFIRRCKEIKADHPIRVVFLDSWEHIHFLTEPHTEDIVEAFKKIKSLARELKLTIVINMKLSREIEEEYREYHLPEPYDFMIPDEALDETAGLMALYRKSYYRGALVEDKEKYKEEFQVNVFRTRIRNYNGALLVFSPYNMRLDDWSFDALSDDSWYIDDWEDEEFSEGEACEQFIECGDDEQFSGYGTYGQFVETRPEYLLSDDLFKSDDDLSKFLNRKGRNNGTS